jgi:hypothetical protein
MYVKYGYNVPIPTNFKISEQSMYTTTTKFHRNILGSFVDGCMWINMQINARKPLLHYILFPFTLCKGHIT